MCRVCCSVLQYVAACCEILEDAFMMRHVGIKFVAVRCVSVFQCSVM